LVHNGGIAEKGFTVPDSKRDQATVGKKKKKKLQLEKHPSYGWRSIEASQVIQSAVVKTGVVNIFGYTV